MHTVGLEKNLYRCIADHKFDLQRLCLLKTTTVLRAFQMCRIAADRISLVMGATRLQDSIANRTASEVFVHEQYNATGGLENDIALLRVRERLVKKLGT